MPDSRFPAELALLRADFRPFSPKCTDKYPRAARESLLPAKTVPKPIAGRTGGVLGRKTRAFGPYAAFRGRLREGAKSYAKSFRPVFLSSRPLQGPISTPSGQNSRAAARERRERARHVAAFRSQERVFRGRGDFPADRRSDTGQRGGRRAPCTVPIPR